MDKNLENVQVSPFDNVEALLTQMGKLYEARGDPVTEWNLSTLQIKIVGPLAGFAGESSEG